MDHFVSLQLWYSVHASTVTRRARQMGCRLSVGSNVWLPSQYSCTCALVMYEVSISWFSNSGLVHFLLTLKTLKLNHFN